jgi:hypothetical protein
MEMHDDYGILNQVGSVRHKGFSVPTIIDI